MSINLSRILAINITQKLDIVSLFCFMFLCFYFFIFDSNVDLGTLGSVDKFENVEFHQPPAVVPVPRLPPT